MLDEAGKLIINEKGLVKDYKLENSTTYVTTVDNVKVIYFTPFASVDRTTYHGYSSENNNQKLPEKSLFRQLTFHCHIEVAPYRFKQIPAVK